MTEPLVLLEDVKLYFPVRKGLWGQVRSWIKAVDGVSLTITKGQALGLVGESGCGKTTLVNGLLDLERFTAGKALFDGDDLRLLKGRVLRNKRAGIQIVFQDPFTSLNPRWLVRDIVAEPIRVHEKLTYDERLQRVAAVLDRVGLSPDDTPYRYPYEFSAGMRQRIAIARALIVQPQLVVLDEPTSAIDVMSQYQILHMLSDLKEDMGLTFILVSHDLSVVRYLATHIAVMYLGKLVEYGSALDVFAAPAHPYTRALFAAMPDPRKRGEESLAVLEGEVPSALNPPPGCHFHERCSLADDRCALEEPPQYTIGESHWAACWRYASTGAVETLGERQQLSDLLPI